MTGRFPSLRDLAQAALRDNDDLLYRHAATWSDGTTCRFSVQDPSKTSGGSQLAQRLTGLPDVLDVRLLRVHLDDPKPGGRASIPWDGGTLTLEDWSQASDFTGQAIGICRMVR